MFVPRDMITTGLPRDIYIYSFLLRRPRLSVSLDNHTKYRSKII